jgi:hypothetical protein
MSGIRIEPLRAKRDTPLQPNRTAEPWRAHFCDLRLHPEPANFLLNKLIGSFFGKDCIHVSRHPYSDPFERPQREPLSNPFQSFRTWYQSPVSKETIQDFDCPADPVKNRIDITLAYDFQDRLIKEFLHILPFLKFFEGMHNKPHGVFEILLITPLLFRNLENLLEIMAGNEIPQ